MGPTARDAGNCPNLRMAATEAVVDGIAIEQPLSWPPKLTRRSTRRMPRGSSRLAAAGYQVLKNGTMAFIPVGKGNGVPRNSRLEGSLWETVL